MCFFMYFIECSDFLQHGGRPDGVARYLVAKMSCSCGGIDGSTFGGDGQDAAFGECEEPVALHSLDGRHDVPHALPRITVAGHIHLFDGVSVRP